jgi:hypothetical protein
MRNLHLLTNRSGNEREFDAARQAYLKSMQLMQETNIVTGNEQFSTLFEVCKVFLSDTGIRRNLASSVKTPTYNVPLDGGNLSIFLKTKKQWLRNQLATMNRKPPSSTHLGVFLDDCRDLFGLTEALLNNDLICKSIGLSVSYVHSIQANDTRLSIGVDKLLDTGRNIALFGEAGAGKTTSLQYYAKQTGGFGAAGKIVLYLPLAAVFGPQEKKPTNEELAESKVQALFVAIARYLRREGVDIAENEILRAVTERTCVLLLDGLDEISKIAPWFIEAIEELPIKHPTIQIVVAARSGGNLQDKISFIGTTLLPFTPDQVSHFVQKWLCAKGRPELVGPVQAHLDNNLEVSKVVTSPLLATILCVLADSGVPLPDTEIRLYMERFRLLYGDYDVQKKATRIESQRSLLEQLSKKIAYKLHANHRREAHSEQLVEFGVTAFGGKVERVEIEKGVGELFSPCNILTPMTADGRFGFGHLRYQEYLAACELNNNRGIDIGPLLADSWWRGALTLYAQMADDVEHLIIWLAENGTEASFSKAVNNLQSMINVRSPKERAGLSELLKMHIKLDPYD